jgi:hypothetical protein
LPLRTKAKQGGNTGAECATATTMTIARGNARDVAGTIVFPARAGRRLIVAINLTVRRATISVTCISYGAAMVSVPSTEAVYPTVKSCPSAVRRLAIEAVTLAPVAAV